jgi:hypothetical protein
MLGEPYELAGTRASPVKTSSPLPLDHSVPAFASRLMIGVVPRIFEARRHGAGGRPPMCARGHLPERIMRTLLVVVPAETIEGPLLLGRCRSSWLARLGLQFRCMRS